MNRPRISLAFSTGAILAELASASLAATPEAAAGSTTIRSGNHADFGRLIVETDGKVDYRPDQTGDRVVLRFADDVILGSPPPLPLNVTAIRTEGPVLELTLKHGARLHWLRVDGRIVLDVVNALGNGTTPADESTDRGVAASSAGTATSGGRARHTANSRGRGPIA